MLDRSRDLTLLATVEEGQIINWFGLEVQEIKAVKFNGLFVVIVTYEVRAPAEI